jgi:DNA-binding transcriptional ArsR family regulator
MDIIQIEKILKAAANRRRLKILRYLKDHKRVSVSELAGHIKLSFKSTSRHLAILRNTDLVETEQVSLTILYSLSSSAPKVLEQILSHF